MPAVIDFIMNHSGLNLRFCFPDRFSVLFFVFDFFGFSAIFNNQNAKIGCSFRIKRNIKGKDCRFYLDL